MCNCNHKYVIKSEDVYLPDYSKPATIIQPCPVLVPIEQYECLCCNQKLGYVPYTSKLIQKPIDIKGV